MALVISVLHGDETAGLDAEISEVRGNELPHAILTKRLLNWERKVFALIQFFKRTRSFQENLSVHYSDLCKIIHRSLNEDDADFSHEGAMAAWIALKEKTGRLSLFHAERHDNHDKELTNQANRVLNLIRDIRKRIHKAQRMGQVLQSRLEQAEKDSNMALQRFNTSLTTLGDVNEDPFVLKRRKFSSDVN
jgi:hypothetical protein